MTQTLSCDACGEPIKTLEGGIIVWEKGREFAVLHHEIARHGCDNQRRWFLWNHLSYFTDKTPAELDEFSRDAELPRDDIRFVVAEAQRLLRSADLSGLLH
jgi:hypothetical protein